MPGSSTVCSLCSRLTHYTGAVLVKSRYTMPTSLLPPVQKDHGPVPDRTGYLVSTVTILKYYKRTGCTVPGGKRL